MSFSGVRRAVRARLSPAVQRLRRTRADLAERLWPSVPWDGRHHPILQEFPPWEGIADGTQQYDFIGTRTDPEFRPSIRPQPAGPLRTRHPSPSATYFEWIVVLSAVGGHRGADRPFVMFELGAGYGPWLAVAGRALARIGAADYRFVGVEMERQRFDWMARHLAVNGVDLDRCELLQGAVSDRDGVAHYPTGRLTEYDYGLRMTAGDAKRSGGETVRRMRLSPLLARYDAVDLVHLDVQGEEHRVLREAAGELRARASRVLVATHSRAIHRRCRRLMRENGWNCVYDFGFGARALTPFGHVRFLDGLLAYESP